MLLDYNEALKQKTLPPRKTMVKQGTLPGIYAGTRFKVNYDLLVKQLNHASEKAVREG